MKSYSEIIRGLRDDKDLKQDTVANLLGISQQQYSSYETGQTEPSVRMLTLLADFYGVSADYILGRTRCREGVDVQNQNLTTDNTIGEVISSMLALSPRGRAGVVEHILLRQLQDNDDRKRASTDKHRRVSQPD
ncbi:MAG: helix-turn-helix domain-containing protein [Defluviitaleaceae bacterium]|nr:helix-turn-helix domain-containing protein [Defluviitaleaceae bacterium]